MAAVGVSSHTLVSRVTHPPLPLLQVRTRLAVCPSGTYRGIADCARKVLAQEGWRAFYRGMVPSMLGILPYAGVDITIFELLKERLLDEVGGRACGLDLIGGKWGNLTRSQACRCRGRPPC